MAFISAIVVLLVAVLDLPSRFKNAYQTIFTPNKTCNFIGRILDANNNPVVNAEVIVQGKKRSGFTDDNGEFYFKVKEKKGTRIQVFIKRDGIIKYNGGQTLPGPAIIKLKDES